METTIYILAVALAAAIVLLIVGLVGGIIHYRCRLKDSHRTLACFIKENILLREGRGGEKAIEKYESRKKYMYSMKQLSNFRMAMATALICLPILFASCSKEEANTPGTDSTPNSEAEVLAFAPLLQWGCSIADVERHIQSKAWWQDGNDRLEYWADPYQSWHKWYWMDAENAITEQYLFETEDGHNLRYALCICWNNTVPAEKFVNTLIHQGFHATGVMVEFDGDTHERYLSADGQTEALYNTDAEGYSEAIYRPVEK